MTYQLGIDLGTTYTAAAVCRPNGRAEVIALGGRNATVASVLYLGADGSVLVGEAAERRALTDPDRVVREFKRRIGDDTPIIIGGTPHHAHDLAARMISWVVERVAEREGGPATRIAITHPASWGTHRKELLAGALRATGLSVTFLAEPQAAAVSYASAERVESGSTIAVYDLGGGTFDAAVVRKNGTFTLLGQPEGIDRLGGIDFDEAVYRHVRESVGFALDQLDPSDPDALSAVAALRRECVDAKEALSSDTEVTIPVLLPGLRTQARLVRAEFEGMIRPQLEDTIEALRNAVTSAGLRPTDLAAVLLVGGSSRIPLVSQLVSEALGRPVAVDAHPKNSIAVGAALAISPTADASAAVSAGAPSQMGAAPVGAPPTTPPRSSPPPAAPPQQPYGAPQQQPQYGAPQQQPQYGPPPQPWDAPPQPYAPAGAPQQGPEQAGSMPAWTPTQPGPPERPPMPPGPAQPAAPGGQSDGSRRKLFLLIGIAALVAAIGVAAVVFLLPRSNGGSGGSTASTSAPSVVATIAVGNEPDAMALSPDGATAYVADSQVDTVYTVDIASAKVVKTLDVTNPSGLAVTPDGKRLYVANLAPNTVTVVDTATNTASATIPVGEAPLRVSVSSDGAHVYVTNRDSGTVSVIDTATNEVSATVKVADRPYQPAITPDGSRLYVTSPESSAITVIDLPGNNVVTTIPLEGAFTVAFSPDGKQAWVPNVVASTVVRLDTTTNQVTGTVAVGKGAVKVVATSDFSKLFVSNIYANTVSVISTADARVIATLNVGRNPSDEAVSPDSSRIYVVNQDGSLSVIDAGGGG